MSTSLTRRKLVAGAAWAAPVSPPSTILYAASVAADCTRSPHTRYSISGGTDEVKTVRKLRRA